MSLFGAVRWSLTGALPYAVEKLAECRISIRRIEAFLTLPEIAQIQTVSTAAVSNDAGSAEEDISVPTATALTTAIAREMASEPVGSIAFRNASFSWMSAATDAASEPPTLILRKISLSIKPGSLVAVVGPVGYVWMDLAISAFWWFVLALVVSQHFLFLRVMPRRP